MYARIIKVKGATVDRRTRNYACLKTLERGIRREMRSLGIGPFLVEVYGQDGQMITWSMEG